MKTILSILSLSLLLTSCYRVKPDAGQEAVLIYKPLVFGHGGVDDDPVSTGASWCAVTTEHVLFSILPTTIEEKFEDMIPADQTPISFSAYLKVQVRKGHSPELYEKFGKDWYEHSIQQAFRTMIRNRSCIYTMFDLAGKREISERLQKEIFNDISLYAKNLNIPVDIIEVTLGKIIPPDKVLEETKNTAAQNQSILTQDARAKAELARKNAEINKALADQAYQLKMNMTVAEYLQLRGLELQKEKIQLIKDNNKVTIIMGETPVTYPVK